MSPPGAGQLRVSWYCCWCKLFFITCSGVMRLLPALSSLSRPAALDRLKRSSSFAPNPPGRSPAALETSRATGFAVVSFLGSSVNYRPKGARGTGLAYGREGYSVYLHFTSSQALGSAFPYAYLHHAITTAYSPELQELALNVSSKQNVDPGTLEPQRALRYYPTHTRSRLHIPECAATGLTTSFASGKPPQRSSSFQN